MQRTPTIEGQNGVTRVVFGPEFEMIDDTDVVPIEQVMENALERNRGPWVGIELPHTRLCCSRFLALLIRIWKRQYQAGEPPICLVGVHEEIREILQITQLDQLIDIYDSYEQLAEVD